MDLKKSYCQRSFVASQSLVSAAQLLGQKSRCLRFLTPPRFSLNHDADLSAVPSDLSTLFSAWLTQLNDLRYTGGSGCRSWVLLWMDHFKIILARRLTNYQTLPNSSITSRTVNSWHNSCRRSDQVFWSTPLLTTKCGPNSGFAYFETSNPENIPLETSTSEFPFVFSRIASGPSS